MDPVLIGFHTGKALHCLRRNRLHVISNGANGEYDAVSTRSHSHTLKLKFHIEGGLR